MIRIAVLAPPVQLVAPVGRPWVGGEEGAGVEELLARRFDRYTVVAGKTAPNIAPDGLQVARIVVVDEEHVMDGVAVAGIALDAEPADVVADVS